MIRGVGTDIIEIARVARAAERPNFLARWFTESERALFESAKAKKNARIAANFAAKEAVAKALGTGFVGFSPADIEVLRNPAGAPYVNLYAGAAERAAELRISQIFISLSHCENYAVAYAVAEA